MPEKEIKTKVSQELRAAITDSSLALLRPLNPRLISSAPLSRHSYQDGYRRSSPSWGLEGLWELHDPWLLQAFGPIKASHPCVPTFLAPHHPWLKPLSTHAQNHCSDKCSFDLPLSDLQHKKPRVRAGISRVWWPPHELHCLIKQALATVVFQI